MKKLLPVLVLMLIVSASCWAQGVPSPSTPRLMIDGTGQLMDATHGLTTTLASSNATLTMAPIGLNGNHVTSGWVLLATHTSTLLSSLATPTPGLFLVLHPWSKIHRGPVGTATSTLQLLMPMSAAETIYISISSSTFNLALIADSASVATLSYEVYNQK